MKKVIHTLFEKFINCLYIFSLIFVLGFQSNGMSFEKYLLGSTSVRYFNLFGIDKSTNSPPNAASDSYTGLRTRTERRRASAIRSERSQHMNTNRIRRC